MSKPYQHVRIPLSLILDSPGVKASTIAVYVALASFADVNGIAWPSIKTTAKRAKVSQATVRKEIDRLKSYGLLLVKPRTEIINGKPHCTSHLYTLTWHKKYLRNMENHQLLSDENQLHPHAGTTPGIKRERRTTTSTNDNQVNHSQNSVVAELIVRDNWKSEGSTQTKKDILALVAISIQNGIPEEAIAKALKKLGESGPHYISKYSLATALESGKAKGSIPADQKVDWSLVNEQF